MLDNDAEGCVSARASNHRVKSVRACHPLTRSAGPGTGGGGGIACFDDDFEAAFASMAASCRSREHVERCVTFLDRTTRPPSAPSGAHAFAPPSVVAVLVLRSVASPTGQGPARQLPGACLTCMGATSRPPLAWLVGSCLVWSRRSSLSSVRLSVSLVALSLSATLPAGSERGAPRVVRSCRQAPGILPGWRERRNELSVPRPVRTPVRVWPVPTRSVL